MQGNRGKSGDIGVVEHRKRLTQRRFLLNTLKPPEGNFCRLAGNCSRQAGRLCSRPRSAGLSAKLAQKWEFRGGTGASMIVYFEQCSCYVPA